MKISAADSCAVSNPVSGVRHSRRRILRLGAAGLFASCAATKASAAAAADSQAQAGASAQHPGVAAYLTGLEAYGFAGAVLAVRGGETVHLSAHGQADHTSASAWTPETRFDTGSVTKQFTAAAIMALVADGVLSTSDAIGVHLPDVPTDKAAITIHQLLTHSAGLDGGFGGDYDTLSRADFLKLVYASELIFAPGTGHAYSNPGYGVLAAIIEIVTRRPVDAFMTERLFRPSGMSSTGYAVPEGPTIARGYFRGAPRDFVERTRRSGGDIWNLIGNGGVYSTMSDLRLWDEALAVERLFPAAIRDRLFEPQVVAVPNYRASGGALYYGYGWYVWPDAPGGRQVWHLGGNGTSNCAIRRHEATGLTVMYASNVSEFHDPAYPAPVVERILSGEHVAPPPPLAASPEAALVRLEGRYADAAGSSLLLKARGRSLDVSGGGQAAFTFLRGGRWRAEPELARYNDLTLRIFQNSRDGRFDDIIPFYPETSTSEGVAAFERSFWSKRETALGAFRGIRVLGSRRAAGGSTAHTLAAADFERGTAWRQYTWAAPDRLGEVNAVSGEPSLTLFLTQDGDLISFDPSTGTERRIRPGTDPAHLLIPVEGETPARLERT